VSKAPVPRLGPCEAVPACRDKCPGWVPHPLLDDVFSPCECGHSRAVHRLGPPVIPEPAPDLDDLLNRFVLACQDTSNSLTAVRMAAEEAITAFRRLKETRT
jgi:hypothetical protein